MQKNVLNRLNLKRIENLANKGISKQVFQFKVGNFVLLNGDLATEKGSRSTITPKFRDVYKITQLHSAGFGVRILNLRTGSLQSCSHDKIHLLSLDDLISININTKAFWNISELLQKRGYFRRGKSKVRLNLLEDFDQVLSSGDDGIDCPENNDEVSRPPEIGAKQGAANDDNLIISQPHENQPPAGQNRFWKLRVKLVTRKMGKILRRYYDNMI